MTAAAQMCTTAERFMSKAAQIPNMPNWSQIPTNQVLFCVFKASNGVLFEIIYSKYHWQSFYQQSKSLPFTWYLIPLDIAIEFDPKIAVELKPYN